MRNKLLIANIKSLSYSNKVSRLHILIKEISTSKNRWQLCDPTGTIYAVVSDSEALTFVKKSKTSFALGAAIILKDITCKFQLCSDTKQWIIYLTKSNFIKWIFPAELVIPEEYLRISINDQNWSMKWFIEIIVE